MAASNTIECIEELLGEKLIGIIERWPKRTDITSCKALVFESGRALVLSDNGSYWTERAEEVQRVVDGLKKEHERTRQNVERLLDLAGVGTKRSGRGARR